jgi:hypothetical protein
MWDSNQLEDTTMKTIENVTLRSEITCPNCNFTQQEEMPTDACQFFYDCKKCGGVLKPKAADCCVFCSYGSVKCPSIQQGEPCC